MSTAAQAEAHRIRRCPTCGSNSPERHPAVQCEGEVEICVDDFHLLDTNMNRPAYRQAVLDKRQMLAAQGRPAPRFEAA